MFWERNSESGNYQIWLSQDEVETLLDHATDPSKKLAIELGVRCGLRSIEILRVCPRDVKDTVAGDMLRVDSAKSDSKRQTPIPPQLATKIRTIGEVRPQSPGEPLFDVSTRTLRRWITGVCAEIADELDDEMWNHVSMHDLRRTWATSLNAGDVDALIVCDWGGWSDLETFLNHYRGTASPEAQKKQREKVDWL